MYSREFLSILPTLYSQYPDMYIVFYRGRVATIPKKDFQQDPSACISKITDVIDAMGADQECDTGGVMSINEDIRCAFVSEEARLYGIFIHIMLAREQLNVRDNTAPCNDKITQFATLLASLPSRPLEMIAEHLQRFSPAEVDTIRRRG